jgi:hypothetical protein
LYDLSNTLLSSHNRKAHNCPSQVQKSGKENLESGKSHSFEHKSVCKEKFEHKVEHKVEKSQKFEHKSVCKEKFEHKVEHKVEKSQKFEHKSVCKEKFEHKSVCKVEKSQNSCRGKSVKTALRNPDKKVYCMECGFLSRIDVLWRHYSKHHEG